MKPSIRLVASGGTLAILVVSFAALICNGRDGSTMDWGGVRLSLRQTREGQRRSEQLDDRRADVLRRLVLKEATEKEVIAGRLTLREAAARFRALARESPDFVWS